MDSVSFFKLLKKKNKKILAFAVHESWADIGLKQDYLNYKKNEPRGNTIYNSSKKKLQKA